MKNRNKALLITGGIIAVISIIVLFIGGYLAGRDYAAWFTSPIFMWVCVLVGIYLITVIFFLIKDWLDKKL